MQKGASETRPYAPSFVDRLMDFVKRMPGPYWLTYLVLFILQGLIFHILSWIVGWSPAYTFIPVVLLFPAWLWASLAIMTYINSVSLEALSIFSPLLDIEEERLERLKYEFRVMPARSVNLISVIWTIIYILLTYLAYEPFYVTYKLGTLLSVANIVAGLASFSVAGVIYYHSFRQLRLVNYAVRLVHQINLFQLDPVYAFSRVTSQIGVAWMILLSLTILLFPIQFANMLVLAILVTQIALAIAAFVLPLWFVNRRLVSEKRKLLAEFNHRVESTLERLHRDLDAGELSGMDQFDSAMTALTAERDVLTRIPTWPWRAGTLTGFLSAIGLPILLFLMQIVIEKWLGG